MMSQARVDADGGESGRRNELALSMVLASISGASGAGAERHQFRKDALVSALPVPA
jgi:hypothetical protein